MFGEKRKYDVLQDSSSSTCMKENSVTRPEDHNNGESSTSISCECMDHITGAQFQKRMCLAPDGEQMTSRLQEPGPQCEALRARLKPAGDSSSGCAELNMDMEVDLPVVNGCSSTYPHAHDAVSLSSTMEQGLEPSLPKRCLRCASGEPGHIKHILS